MLFWVSLLANLRPSIFSEVHLFYPQIFLGHSLSLSKLLCNIILRPTYDWFRNLLLPLLLPLLPRLLLNLARGLLIFALTSIPNAAGVTGRRKILVSISRFFVPPATRRVRLDQQSIHQQVGLVRLGRPGRDQHHDGGSPSGISLSSPSFLLSTSSHSTQSFSTSLNQGIHPRTSFQEDHQAYSYTHCGPSILFSPLRGSQEGWPESPHHRPFLPQQDPYQAIFQNGDGLRHCHLHRGTHVGMYGGPQGCFLPRPHGMVLPPVPGLRGGRPGLCLPGASFWSIHRPMGVQPHHQTYKSLHTPFSFPFPHLSGRFPPPCSFRGGSPFPDFFHPLPPSTSGDSGQPQEVPPVSFPDSSVPRGHLPPGFPSTFPSRGQGHEDRFPVPGHHPPEPSLPSTTGVLSGSSKLRLLLRPTGSSSSSAHCELDELPLIGSFQGRSGPSGLLSQGSPSGLDGRVVPHHSCSYVSSSSYPPTHDRRFQVRLGRGPDSPLSFGNMASFLFILFHQLVGTAGRAPFGTPLSTTTSRQLCAAPHGQLDSGRLHSSPRYSTVSGTYVSVRDPSGVLLDSLDHSHPQAPLRRPECPCGSGLPLRACLDRVVSGLRDVCMGDLRVRSVPSGPLCHQGEPSTSRLCVSLPGPGGGGVERVLDSVGQMGLHLPISTSSSAVEGIVSPSPVPGSGSPDCSLLCSVKLAPQPSAQVCGTSSTSARTFPVAEDQQRTGIPPLPLSLLPSRVETIRRGLFAAGFNSAAAEIYLLSHKVSTTGQYQSIWTKFLRFLSSNGYSSKDTSVAVVCNFLTFQATVCKLQYRTISGYRSALRLPLYWGCGLVVSDFVSDQFLKGLFNLIPPRRAAPMPIWSLNILLSYLQSGRFEPLDSVSPELLFQKTLCLLLLASGRRISEIAHLSRLFRLDQSGTSLTLDWVDGFRPKHDDSVFRPDSPSISYLASDGSVSLSLCPVRAYKTLLSFSTLWVDRLGPQGYHTSLWAQPAGPLPLSVKQLTAMFISVVKDALSDAGLSTSLPIGPHQVRKLAASHSRRAGRDEQAVRRLMGFSSVSILRKNYVSEVTPLNVACVLPGGPFFPPRDYDLSDSD